MKFFIPICLIFSSTLLAELSVMDLKSIPALWGDGAISPFDGQSALYEFSHYRALPENYGERKFPYPCHYQSKLVNQKDCPQSWPAAVLQFLFPLTLVPNQATIYDPLHHLKYNKLADLLNEVAEAQAQGRKLFSDYQLFTKTRARLIATIYPIDGSLLRKPIRENVDRAFATIAPQYSDAQTFLKDFYNAEEKIRAGVVPATRNNQSKRIADHFLSRSVAENFVNAILGTLDLAESKVYYRSFVTKALYAYFSGIAENRDEIFMLHKHLTKTQSTQKAQRSSSLLALASIEPRERFHKSMLEEFMNAHPIQGEDNAFVRLRKREIKVDDKRAWVQQQYNDGFGDVSRISRFLDQSFDASTSMPSLGNPDEFAALITFANTAQMRMPPLMRYKTATVNYNNGRKMQTVTHSDCGETFLRFLLGLGFYDDELGDYNPDLWITRIEHFHLKPHAGIMTYYSQGENGKRSLFDDQKNGTHNSFSELVTSNLNQPGAFGDDVLYTKPNENPFTEINPGIDNILNVIRRLFGDAHDEEPYSPEQFVQQVSARRATLSLNTLYRLKNQALANAEPGQQADVVGKFRKYQMNRFFKLISPLPISENSVIRWIAQTRDDEFQSNFETLTIIVSGLQFNWEIAADHFDLYLTRGYDFTHRFAYLKDQLIETLLERAKVHPTYRSNLHRLIVNSRHLPETKSTVNALKEVFLEEPELIYAFPLRMPSDQVRVAQWIIRHNIEKLYPVAARWLATIPKKSGEACFARFELGATFENILVDETLLPSSPNQHLIDSVIRNIEEPLVLAFTSSSGNNALNSQMLRRILALRGHEPDVIKSFFYRQICGVNPAMKIARAGLHDAFSYFEDHFPGHGRDWLKSNALYMAINDYRSPPVQQWQLKQNAKAHHPQTIVDTGPMISRLLVDNNISSEDLLVTKYGKPSSPFGTGDTILHQVIHTIAYNSDYIERYSEYIEALQQEHWAILHEALASRKFTRKHFLATDYKGNTVLHKIAEHGLLLLLDFIKSLELYTDSDLAIKNDAQQSVNDLIELAKVRGA